MQWITQSNALNNINDTLYTLNVLKNTFTQKNLEPIKFIEWLLATDTAANFQADTDITIHGDDAKLIEQFVDKLQTGVDKQYQPLFHPLNALDANGIESNIEFELLNQNAQSDPQQLGDLTLNLAGSTKASITLEGNDTAPLIENKRAVSISANGQLQAKVGGEFPVNIGSLSGYSNLTGSAGVTTMSQIDDSELFISALIQTVENSANPFDLTAIADKVATPECFAKQTIALQGELAYGGAMALGYKTQDSVALVVSSSASIGYDASIKGNFDLIIEKADQNAINITLKRGKSQSGTKSFAIGVNVDASAIATQVSEKLNAKLEGNATVLQQAIKEINDLYSPGAYIEQQINALLNSPDLSPTLLESAKLALGQGNVEDTKTALTTKLTDTLKTEFFTWSGNVSNQTQHFITLLAEKANVPANELTPARAQFTAFFSNLSNTIDTKLRVFADQNANRITNLLADVGVNINRLTNAVQPVDQAKAGLVKLITDLQNRISETVSKIANKDNHQLQAKLTSSTAKTTGTDLLLQYRFDFNDEANLPAQQELFEQLIKGRTKALFANAQTRQSISGVTLEQGVLTTTADATESDVAHLSLFGADIDYKALLDVKTKVVQNANGDIQIVSQAQYHETFSALGIKQGAQFIDLFNLATNKSNKNSTVNINFALTLSDEKLKHTELNNVVQELENKSLISATFADDLTEDYLEVSQGNSINSALTFTLALNQQQAKYMLGASSTSRTDSSPQEVYRQRFTQAFNLQLTVSRAVRGLEDIMRKKLKANFKPYMSFADFMESISLTDLNNIEADLQLNNSLRIAAYKNVKRIKQNADAYASMIAIMSEIYHADLDDLTAVLLRQKQTEIGHNLKLWVDSFADLLQLLRPNLPNDSLGLAQLLIESSGEAEDERASLSAQAIYKDQTFNYPKED